MTIFNIINYVKYSPIAFRLYNYIGSSILKICKYFIKKDKNLVIFVSYGGRKYDDSPKAIYEEMIKDERFSSIKYLWAFLDPSVHDLPAERKINISSFKYFIKLLKASAWITNSSVERGLTINNKNTFYLNTWHGTPIKKMGLDASKESNAFSKEDGQFPSIMLAQSDYEIDILSRIFSYPQNIFKKIGLPRNDELVKGNNPNTILQIKHKLKIPQTKKILLYAPTFREYDKDNLKNCIFRPPLNFKNWEKDLSQNYILLIRAHYEVAKQLHIQNSDFIRNVSEYESLNELMLISDILISDYSSIFFDFSILARPMLTFCYDYENYSCKRGLYFDIREALKSRNNTEEELLDEIKNINFINRSQIASNFRDTYIEAYGDATLSCCDIIAHHIL